MRLMEGFTSFHGHVMDGLTGEELRKLHSQMRRQLRAGKASEAQETAEEMVAIADHVCDLIPIRQTVDALFEMAWEAAGLPAPMPNRRFAGLKDRKVLVTGSTAGIDFAIASLLAQAGASVVVNGRSQERVEEAVQRLQRENEDAQVTGIAADLSTNEGVGLLTAKVPAVDILVNNLGLFDAKPFADNTDEDWLRFFDVNVLSGVRLSRFYLSLMLQRKWGRVVFLSSDSWLHIPVDVVPYGVTKAGQIALARGLARTTAGTGVTVNAVLPGPTRTEGTERFVQRLATAQGRDAETIEASFFPTVDAWSPRRRFESPKKAATTVLYMCSPRASAMNGEVVRGDGSRVRFDVQRFNGD